MDEQADQRREALTKANGIRDARAKLKRELKSNTKTLSAVVAYPPDFVANMKIGELLSAARGFGAVRVAKLLARCEVGYSRRIGNLSTRQRELIAREVEREYERAYRHAKASKTPSGTPLTANSSASGRQQLR